MYAGALGDNAVERYALFLTSLALSADPIERRTALQRAREHGLDVPRVAIVTAERTIERALDSLPSSVKGQLPDLAKVAQEPAEEAEMLLVRSIEWTVVESETYDTALEQANVILRYLLGTRISSPHLSSHVAYAQSCCKQLAGGSMWRACSWICCPLNWRRSAHLRSVRQSIWITASSSSRGRCLSGWQSVRLSRRRR
jgi:hypothetical protein